MKKCLVDQTNAGDFLKVKILLTWYYLF